MVPGIHRRLAWLPLALIACSSGTGSKPSDGSESVEPLDAAVDAAHDQALAGDAAIDGPAALDASSSVDLPDAAPLPTYLSVWGAGPADVYAGDRDGNLRHWDGVRWSDPMSLTRQRINALWGTGASNVWAVGDQQLFHYDGTTWKPTEVPNRLLALKSIHGSSATDVWVGGQDGMALHFDGNGWSEHSIPGAADVTGLWVRTPTEVWAACGSLRRWDGQWSTIATPADGEVKSVYAAGAGDVWVGGRGAYHGGGGTWTLSPEWKDSDPLRPNFNALWGLGPADIYGVTPFALFHYDGKTWSSVFEVMPQINLRAVWSGGGSTWVLGDEGLVHHQ